MTTDNTHGFRKAVTIFIDILGSQDRENFDEWYNIMRIFADTVFVKRKCEQKGPKKVSTFSTRFHVVSNVFPKYQMLNF